MAAQRSIAANVSRLLTGKFPNWQVAVPKKFTHAITADAEEFGLLLKQAALGLDRTIATRWTLSKKRLEVFAGSPEREGCGAMAIDCPTLNGDEVVLGVNGPMVSNFLAAVTGPVTFSFTNPNQPYELLPQIEGFDYQYITIGMRPDTF